MNNNYTPNLPEGLDAAILAVLETHTGREKAIGRTALVAQIQFMHFSVDERTVREGIKALRRRGHLICSVSGPGGGYYKAANKAEFDEFYGMEFAAKIADMRETGEAMQQAARQFFGQGQQLELM